MIDLSLEDQERTTPALLRLHIERIYLDTSILSFCHETRQEPDMVDRRNSTIQWFDEHAANYELLISEYVAAELMRGSYPFKADAVKMLRGLPVLKDLTGEIAYIANVYLENRLMPKGEDGDAWHMAMASFHRCDYLLSWNRKHLVNPNKLRHIRTINSRLGLSTPRLVTPAILLREAQNVRSKAGSTTPEN